MKCPECNRKAVFDPIGIPEDWVCSHCECAFSDRPFAPWLEDEYEKEEE